MYDNAPANTGVQYGLPAIALLAAVGFALSGAGSHAVWYVVRATGIVSYVLVTITVICGMLVTNRALPPGERRFDVFEAHRFLALLAICGAGFHALTLLLDSYIGFSAAQILVPFTSAYRPVSVGLGVLALYVAIAVYFSFYARRWIGQKAWRTLHYATFGVFALATYHGILSGADTGRGWMLTVYLVAIVSVLGLLVVRIARASDEAGPKRERLPARRGEIAMSSGTSPRSGRPDNRVAPENLWRRPEALRRRD